MGKLRDAIRIETDALPATPYGRRIRASLEVVAETVTSERLPRSIYPQVIDELKIRIIYEVYGDFVSEMQVLRKHIYDLAMQSNSQIGFQKFGEAKESWTRLMELIQEG